MFNQFVKGETPISIDSEIDAIYAKYTDEEGSFGGMPRFVGILNDAGRLCRVISADSPIEASNVVEALIDLGMIDRIGFADKGGDFVEIDTLTGERIATLWTALLQLGRTAHTIPLVPSFD